MCALVNPTEHKVSVYLAPGGIATVCTQEVYVLGPTASAPDVVFRRPVDANAAVTKLTVTVNGVAFVGKVQTVQEATRTYLRAVDAGKRAALVKHDEVEGDEYKVHLGNLSGGDRVVVDMEYVALLTNKSMFVISKSATPRYARSADTTTTGSTRGGGGVFRSFARLFGAGRAAAATDTTTTTFTSDVFLDYSADPDITSVRVLTPGTVTLDVGVLRCTCPGGCEGFAVQLNNANERPHTTFSAREHPTDGTTALLASLVPTAEMLASGKVDASPTPVFFVVDCSGSMAGRRIAQVRDALQFFLLSLAPGTPVELYKFGTKHSALFGAARGPQPLTDELMRTHVAPFCTALGADMGGTEVWGVLGDVFTRPGVKNVLFITDGEIADKDSVTKLCRAHRHAHRIFAFGIEAMASRDLVQSIAESTSGTYEILYDVNDLSAKATSLVRTMSETFGQSCAVDWGVPTLYKTLTSACALRVGTRVDFMSIVATDAFRASHSPVTLSFVVNSQRVVLDVPRGDVRVLNGNINLHAAAALKCIHTASDTDAAAATVVTDETVELLKTTLSGSGYDVSDLTTDRVRDIVTSSGMLVETPKQVTEVVRFALAAKLGVPTDKPVTGTGGLDALSRADVTALALKYNIMVQGITAFVAVDPTGLVVSNPGGDVPLPIDDVEKCCAGTPPPRGLVKRGGKCGSLANKSVVVNKCAAVRRGRAAADEDSDGGDDDSSPPRRSGGAFPMVNTMVEKFKRADVDDEPQYRFARGARPAPMDSPEPVMAVGTLRGKALEDVLLAAARMSGAFEFSPAVLTRLFPKSAVEAMISVTGTQASAVTVLAIALIDKNFAGRPEWALIRTKACAFVGVDMAQEYLSTAMRLLS